MDGALLIENEADAEPESDDSAVSMQEDGKAELACEMLTEILARMDLEAQVRIREDAEEVVLDVSGDDVGRIIGKKGQTLDALQFLINKIVNRFPEGRRHILIDCGDYRERRESGLASLARREARRAVQQGRVVTLEPMSPRDRRVVHMSLAKFNGVSTRSEGTGMDRRVRIIPARRNARPWRERSSRNRDDD
jgi:spoIIIJ-associated protein